MSPARKRRAVDRAQEELKVSERQACEALGQPRSTQRYRPKDRDEEKALVEAILELVGRYPRYGCRRIWAMLREAGWSVNRKRVHRLWKREGLRVPQKPRKKRALGSGKNGCAKRRAEFKDDVWAWDFIQDATRDGRALKCLSLLDEFTRENLVLEVDRSLRGDDLVEILTDLLELRGAPRYLRSDNGPEFIAKVIQGWLEHSQVGPLYIDPGAPWQNGYAEAFHSRLRDEFFNMEEFETVEEAKVMAVHWQWEYNHRRPHSALGYQTPAAFAAAWARPGSAPLRLVDPTPTSEPLTLITTGT